jgi:hypothetical protein
MGLVDFLEKNMLSCQWKEVGLECTGCGLQRSVIHLLRGEFTEALVVYPAIYTLIVMFAFLGIHLKFNFAKGAEVLKWLFVLNVAIIVVHYFLKFI